MTVCGAADVTVSNWHASYNAPVCGRDVDEASLSLSRAIVVIIAYTRGALDFPVFYVTGPHFRREFDTMVCEVLALCFRKYRLKLIAIASRWDDSDTGYSESRVGRRPGESGSVLRLSGDPASLSMASRRKSFESKVDVGWLSRSDREELGEQGVCRSGSNLGVGLTQPSFSQSLAPLRGLDKRRVSPGTYWGFGILPPIKEISLFSTTTRFTTSASNTLSSSETGNTTDRTTSTTGDDGSGSNFVTGRRMTPITEMSMSQSIDSTVRSIASRKHPHPSN